MRVVFGGGRAGSAFVPVGIGGETDGWVEEWYGL